MKKTIILISLTVLLVSALGYLAIPTVEANDIHPQAVVQTPTPDANGRIVYIVKENDTCMSISLIMKTSLDTIKALNNLDANCSIFVGQQLLLAVITATPELPTVEVTPTLEGPSPTPFRGNGQVCIVLFNDVDGNGVKADTEVFIPDGNISLSDRTGAVSQTAKSSAGPDPVCFNDIPEGDYNISVAVPEAYNPTTALNYPLSLKAGDIATIDFGAQLKDQPTGGKTPSAILGIIGFVLLLAGVGLGIYIWRSGKLK